MIYRGPLPLEPHHDLVPFDSGDPSLDDWLLRRSRANHASGAGRVWVVTTDDRVVAYYASSTAVVARAAASGRARRNQPDPLPAMLLGRLAVDRAHQGRGLGSALLKHFLAKAIDVADLTGLRLVLVHASNDTVADFCAHFGFEPSPIDDLTLMLLVDDLRRP